MYGTYYTTPSTTAYSSSVSSLGSFGVVAFIIALAAAIVVYFVFMKEDNEKKLEGFAKKLYEFLHFKKFFIVDFVKIAYMFASIFITLVALYTITSSVIGCLLILVVGNVVTRISFEAFMVMYSIYENTKEINKKMK